MTSDIPKIAMIVVCLFTFSLIIVSATSNTWGESTIYYERRGLWNYCNKTHCMKLNDPFVGKSMEKRPNAPQWLKNGETPDWLKAVRATIIIAAVFQFFGLVSAVLTLLVKKVRGYVASIFNAATFVFLLITVYVYADRTLYFFEEYKCGVGWGLGFLSVISSFLSAFIGFCIF